MIEPFSPLGQAGINAANKRAQGDYPTSPQQPVEQGHKSLGQLFVEKAARGLKRLFGMPPVTRLSEMETPPPESVVEADHPVASQPED